MESFKQSDAIRDFVFPICTVEQTADGIKFQEFLGTGFLIGSRGHALTAAHVISKHPTTPTAAMFAHQSGGWVGFSILTYYLHEIEDLALLRISGGTWKSPFRLSNTFEDASLNYYMWGYPDDVARELVEEGNVSYRPDLVYAQGYIRRRIEHEIPAIKGTKLFEVSEVVGPGCSGGPLHKKARVPGNAWDVVGIYLGEMCADRGTSRAYAVREDAFRDWHPPIIDCSVLEESQDVTLDTNYGS